MEIKRLLTLTAALRINILARFFCNDFTGDYNKYMHKLGDLQESIFDETIASKLDFTSSEIKAAEAVIKKVMNDYNIEIWLD